MARRASALLVAAAACLAGGAAAEQLVPLPPQPVGVPWPTEDWPVAAPAPAVDAAALEAAAAELFRTVGRGGVPDTRALLVVQGGAIALERYAEGFGADTRFHSWSMAKSVTHALAGILVRQGRLALDAPAPVPAWRRDGDPRGRLTLDQLLHMTSGLDNADLRGGEGARSFAARLLYGEGARDQATYAASAPLVHEPDTHWAYSTASSMLVAAVVQREVGGTRRAMARFLREELFAPLGMQSAVVEFDVAGNFLGGAHVWASARDWARFGTLYLRDGVWAGRRILPEGWVDHARTRAPAPNNGVYGAHFWVNGEPREGQWKPLPGGPASAFQAWGNGGQYVVMLPEQDLVLVRLGEQQASHWEEIGGALARVAAAFPARAGEAP